AERRPANERAALRRTMARLRLAELREGTWVRPANLDRPLGAALRTDCTVFTGAAPDGEEASALAARLWDLSGWDGRARAFAACLDRTEDLAGRFTVSAAVLRHLLADPVLPDALLPPDWPGAGLRRRYDAFARHLCEVLRHHIASPSDSGE
ncbi:hypothetical protein N566_08620, partial [Streptomycetaceae bacterium MP113-05]